MPSARTPSNTPALIPSIGFSAPAIVILDQTTIPTSCAGCGAALRPLAKFSGLMLLACRRCPLTYLEPINPDCGAG